MILSTKRLKINSIFSAILLFFLFFGLSVSQLINLTEGNFIIPQIPELPRIYIRSDGNIEPSSVPIQRVGDTYVLTGNIKNYTIVIQRGDILFEGSGHVLDGSYGATGIFLNGVTNVTIKNVEVGWFERALEISVSSQIKIVECYLHTNVKGVVVESSDNVFISRNRLEVSAHPQDLPGFIPVYCLSIVLSSKCLISDNELISTEKYGAKLERGIRLDNSSAITLSNNTLKNCGLFISNSFNNTVLNNTVEGKPLVYLEEASHKIVENAGQVVLINCQGIKVAGMGPPNMGIQIVCTNKSEIMGNEAEIVLKNSYANIISGNKGIIRIADSSKNNILGNIASIYLTRSSENIISKNNCTLDQIPFVVEGIICEGSNNTIKENVLAGSEKILDCVLSKGISVSGSFNIIAYNTIYKAHTAIEPKGDFNTIFKNNILNCYYGIEVDDSSHNIVRGNNVTGPSVWGLIISSGSNNTVHENTFINNSIGVALGSTISRAENNVFYHNNFINNTRHVGKNWEEYGANIWDDGREGNYWSDYNGTDADGDGIGDTPYIIDAENQDRFPLISPFVLSESEKPDSDLPPEPEPLDTASPLGFSHALVVAATVIVCLATLVVYTKFKNRKFSKTFEKTVKSARVK